MKKRIATELLREEDAGSGDVRPVTPEDHARLRDLLQSVDWFNAEERKVIADTVTLKLTEEIRQEDMTPFFATIDRFNVGDTPEYQFTKGLKAYVHEPGTYAPRSTLIQRIQTITTELVTVHPEMELSQLQGGRYGSMASMKNMAREELIGHKNAILWNTLTGSIASGSADGNYTAWAQSTDSVDLKKNLLVSGLDYVDDIAPGGPQAIVGRRSLLGFINELNGYSETLKTDVDFVGRGGGGVLLGHFRGIPLIALHQYTDGYDVNRINPDNIMIVARDTTRLAITEDLSTLEDINIDDRMWHWRISEKYGAAVFWPERNYRIAVS
jgi:hypothetical protein